MKTKDEVQITAARIARDLFALGDELGRPDDKAQRLQFKGGTYPDKETCLGGLCEEALAGYIESSLRKQRISIIPEHGLKEGIKSFWRGDGWRG